MDEGSVTQCQLRKAAMWMFYSMWICAFTCKHEDMDIQYSKHREL